MNGGGARSARAYDVVVIGSGIAGLVAALSAAPRARVAVVTKAALDEGCSRYAQGGIAAAVSGDDSPDLHFEDTVAAGRGLCDERAVRALVEEAPRRIRELVEWGVGFDTQDGALMVGREAAHSRPRILHARGDGTGLAIESALIERLHGLGVDVYERHHATRLLLDQDGRCNGVECVDGDTGQRRSFAATATVLASGGAGRLWRYTTNPEPATGDGIALAWEAGAEVAGMEFVQFHPTALALEGAPRFLISEAVRGEGAHVVNAEGERFLLGVDQRGELAPRDVVAQAIWHELQRSGEPAVYLDCTPLRDRAAVRFPTIHRTCLQFGIDIAHDRIPIAPAAHYLIGGVRTDLRGSTSIAGLYACGEVASSGVHGANRLASNSLLESVVFAHRAVDAALDHNAEMPPAVAVTHGSNADTAGNDNDNTAPDVTTLTDRLRRTMWEHVGLVRDAQGLSTAAHTVDGIIQNCDGAERLDAVALRAAAVTASLVVAAATARTESRGAHLRSDFPESEERWLGTWVMHKERGSRLDRHALATH
ncbi:MAG TPA: L-aspartate oxidase [Candidatus Angelobacter sp.]|jgi:L-aspartate oxidase|nr:L-aspartate oxidase [Candidatus Angelobacter sp.]